MLLRALFCFWKLRQQQLRAKKNVNVNVVLSKALKSFQDFWGHVENVRLKEACTECGPQTITTSPSKPEFLFSGGPRYSRTCLSANSLIHNGKNGQIDYSLVKYGLFNCELKIRGPKWQIVSIANYEGNLYFLKHPFCVNIPYKILLLNMANFFGPPLNCTLEFRI